MSGLLFGQQMNFYPKDQHSYLGGDEAFYKDFHNVLISKKLKPCENKSELFKAVVIINEDNSAKLYTSANLPEEENKCAQNLTEQVLKEMSGFISAKIKGEVKAALVSYPIFPDALFENYTDGYSPEKFFKIPEFKGGIKAFRNEVMNRVDPSGFQVKGSGKVTVVAKISIDEKGKMEKVVLEKSSGLLQYDDMIISAIKSIKKPWTPATMHRVPIKYNFKLPISLSDDRL